jgi:hypothetical protein
MADESALGPKGSIRRMGLIPPRNELPTQRWRLNDFIHRPLNRCTAGGASSVLATLAVDRKLPILHFDSLLTDIRRMRSSVITYSRLVSGLIGLLNGPRAVVGAAPLGSWIVAGMRRCSACSVWKLTGSRVAVGPGGEDSSRRGFDHRVQVLSNRVIRLMQINRAPGLRRDYSGGLVTTPMTLRGSRARNCKRSGFRSGLAII